MWWTCAPAIPRNRPFTWPESGYITTHCSGGERTHTKGGVTGVGTSLFLIAVGAILDFAVTAQARGFNINTVGLVLMIVGGAGLVMSLAFWSSRGGFGRYRRSVEYRDGPYPDRTVVYDERTF